MLMGRFLVREFENRNKGDLKMVRIPKELCRESFDPVKKPKHYNIGNIEVITYIKDKLSTEEFKGYIKGNVLKYVSREEHKGGLEDLQKAKWYLDYLIKEVNYD